MTRKAAALGQSFRLFRTHPGVAISAVLALAMGIGFTTTMVGIVHGATRTLPVDRPEQIVAVDKLARVPEGTTSGARAADLRLWRSVSTSFVQLAAFETYTTNLGDSADAPERAATAAITADAFALLGAVPQAGRSLADADAEPGAPAVAVISDALWRRRYAAAPAALGRTIRLDGRPHVIVGIMPPRFAFPINQSVWVPLAVPANSGPAEGAVMTIFGRLRDGVTMAQAGDEITALARSAANGAGAGDIRASVFPFVEIETPRDTIRALYLMVLAVSFVLVIACSNVANLLLARAASRDREIAVKLALGAERRHLIAAQLREALTLATLASVLGLAFAWIATSAFAANTSHIIEAYWVDFRVDPTVALTAAGLAGFAAVASGLAPALRASRATVTTLLAGSAGSTMRLGRFGRSLIGVQVALACGVLALTMVLARASVTLRALEWPFDPHGILTAQLGDITTPAGTSEAAAEAIATLVGEVRASPGVTAAAAISALPGRGGGSWTFGLDARPAAGNRRTTAIAAVSPDFLDVFDARVLAGRALRDSDDAHAPGAAVVNRSFVQRQSPDRNPLGRQIFLGSRAYTIVGVVPDLMAADIQDKDQQGVYIPISQLRAASVRLMLRGSGDPFSLAAPLRAAIARVDRDLPVTEVFTLHEAAFRDKRVLDVLSLLFSLFGLGALTLTGIGLYSVLSFTVASRTREISIRLALGATRWRVIRLVARQAATVVLAGLVVGIALAVAVSIGFSSAIEQVSPASWSLLFGIAACLGLTCALALVVPARRATRVAIVAGLRRT
ncbi:MAG TPA: ABC transporter permease [Vicinamibacterales bacterium]|nr:ABC transporter permease [Vicinamibacterales bacterium]